MINNNNNSQQQFDEGVINTDFYFDHPLDSQI